jgi:hypothetical protein
MQRLTRLLTLLVVVIFTAQPVMACCLEDHADAATAQAEAPCHGSQSQPNQPEPDRSCPGCEDCRLVVEAPDMKPAKSASLDQKTELVPASSDVSTAGFDVRIRGATGPPPPELPSLSLVSLKQQLLI